MEKNTSELLNFCISKGIIDLPDIKKQFDDMKRKELVEKKHNYKIWLGSNGNWYTYVYDSTKKNERRLVKKKNEHDLYLYLADFYEGEIKEATAKEKRMKFDELVERWIEYKKIHTKSTGYIKRILSDYHKYYEPDKDFINRKVVEFNSNYLDIWIHSLIKEKELTQKQYSNASMIIRQSFDYAVSIGIIEENPMEKVKVNTKLYRKTKKKPSSTQVYTVEEQMLLSKELLKRYDEQKNVIPLMILLCFEIGVRVGELCSLKKSDIDEDENHIHVQRQVIKDYKKVDDLKYSFSGWIIGEYTKSDEGDRQVYLTNYAKEIINEAASFNQDGEYIFMKNGNFVNPNDVDYVLQCCCKKANIPVKRIHKIRKTYISTLIDSGLNIDEIRRQVGHSDEHTTYKNYCYNRLDRKQTNDIIEKALNGNQSNHRFLSENA